MSVFFKGGCVEQLRAPRACSAHTRAAPPAGLRGSASACIVCVCVRARDGGERDAAAAAASSSARSLLTFFRSYSLYSLRMPAFWNMATVRSIRKPWYVGSVNMSGGRLAVTICSTSCGSIFFFWLGVCVAMPLPACSPRRERPPAVAAAPVYAENNVACYTNCCRKDQVSRRRNGALHSARDVQSVAQSSCCGPPAPTPLVERRIRGA